MEGLSAAVGRGRLRRHQRAPSSPRQSLEARHRPLQQVSGFAVILNSFRHQLLLTQRRRQLRGPLQIECAHLSRRGSALGPACNLPSK